MPAISGPRKYAWVSERLKRIATAQAAKGKTWNEVKNEHLEWLRNERNTVENDIASLRASLAKSGIGDYRTKGARDNSILLEQQKGLLSFIDRLILESEGRKMQK